MRCCILLGLFSLMPWTAQAQGAPSQTVQGPTGRIIGTLTQEGSGELIFQELVQLFDSSGNFVASELSDSTGRFFIGGLPPGTYFARTVTDNFFDELYDNLPCPLPVDCDVTQGTPIQVNAGADTTGIDFELSIGGRILGALNQEGGSPIPNAWVRLYDETGAIITSTPTDSMGAYVLVGLPTGSFYLRTDSNLFDELYDDLPCPRDCDVTTGTPIPVTFGTDTTGIDFTLDVGGRILGTLTDESGDPLANTRVLLFDETGDYITSMDTAPSGNYEFAGLPTASYFVLTDSNHLDELYDDIPCEWDCEVTTGTPVPVIFGETTAGIDFQLTTSEFLIFGDGFQTGDTSAWSHSVP